LNAYVREYRKIERRTLRRESFFLRYMPILLMLLGVAVVAKIYTQSVATSWSQRLVELHGAAHDLEVRNSELKREIVALTARERIVRDAGKRLGMVVPDERDIVLLPVLDRAGALASHGVEDPDPRLASAVRGVLDALWQEEAFALTSP